MNSQKLKEEIVHLLITMSVSVKSEKMRIRIESVLEELKYQDIVEKDYSENRIEFRGD